MVDQQPESRIERIVIFGATGDLARRYLFPALARLLGSGAVGHPLEVVAVGRRPLTDDEFLARIAPPDAGNAGQDQGDRRALEACLSYRTVDLGDHTSLRELLGDRPLIAYLALPPAVFGEAVEALRDAGIHPDSRIVVEKPFGSSLASAIELNRLIHQVFSEHNVYRIDHFLHHQTVQNLVGLRFANRLFEPLWRTEHVESVDITWDETIGVEGRAGYYDHAGALRDMLQNHLLQLLALVAMEAPSRLDEREVRDRKVTVLRAVRTLAPAEVASQTVRARYTAGVVDGIDYPDYSAEPGVDPSRGTETFASVELAIDNWRWAGVPFRLRAGKALGVARRFVEIRFRPVPHLAFDQAEAPRQNTIRLELRPDRILVSLAVNGPGDPFELEDVELCVEFAPQALPAYARLLLDVLRGDPTLAIRDDEAEESWRIVEPILTAWRAGSPALRTYPAGSAGPDETPPRSLHEGGEPA